MERYKQQFIEGSQVKYFINKYKMKISGSTPGTSMNWIDGIGELSDKEKLNVWKGIQSDIDWKSNKYNSRFDAMDKPKWISKWSRE